MTMILVCMVLFIFRLTRQGRREQFLETNLTLRVDRYMKSYRAFVECHGYTNGLYELGVSVKFWPYDHAIMSRGKWANESSSKGFSPVYYFESDKRIILRDIFYLVCGMWSNALGWSWPDWTVSEQKIDHQDLFNTKQMFRRFLKPSSVITKNDPPSPALPLTA